MELFDQPSWGMTDFTQRMNYRRALEGELERTIGQMRGVESAQVHLALNESPAFAPLDRPSRLRGAQAARWRHPGPMWCRASPHLVASSVDGVDAERVTVLDDSGRLLSLPYEPGSPAALASRELEMRRELERYLEDKAEQLVAQVVGPGNVRVQVAADINFDKVDRTVEALDPDQQVVASEQRAEIIPGPQGGAGSSNVTTSYLNTRTVESFSGAVGGIQRLSVAVLLNAPAAGGKDAPAPLPAATVAQVDALVRNAVGFRPGRGDQISVASIAFRPDVVPGRPAGLLGSACRCRASRPRPASACCSPSSWRCACCAASRPAPPPCASSPRRPPRPRAGGAPAGDAGEARGHRRGRGAPGPRQPAAAPARAG